MLEISSLFYTVIYNMWQKWGGNTPLGSQLLYSGPVGFRTVVNTCPLIAVYTERECHCNVKQTVGSKIALITNTASSWLAMYELSYWRRKKQYAMPVLT